MLQISDTLKAWPREAGNKSSARALRRAKRTPAVAYGPVTKPRNLALDPHEFSLQCRRYGRGHIYFVELEDGGKFRCLIKDIQIDPVTRELLHVDLYEVDMTKPIRVEVPIELIGKAKGIIDGGMLQQVLREVEILVPPDQIPAKLEGDVTALGVGDTLHLSDIKLPANVTLTSHHDEAVALVAEPEKAPESAVPAAGAAPATTASAAKAPDKK